MRTFTYIFSFFIGMVFFCLPQTSFAQCGAGETLYTYCHSNLLGFSQIGFEVCPSAGEVVSAEVVQGGFVFGGSMLTVYEGTVGTGTGGSVVLGPTSMADFTGTTLSSVVPDNCFTYVFSTIPGTPDCATTGNDPQFQVCGSSTSPPSTATLSLTEDVFCSDDGTQTLGGGLPTGGTYSGTGVTDDMNGTTFSFDPSALGGSGTVTVTYTESGNMATDDIMITAAGATTIDVSLTERCIDEGSIVLAGNVSPTGGTFSGTGVTDNGNGIEFTFDPVAAGIGMHTITYTGPDPCNDIVTDMIEVTEACSCPSGQESYFHCQNNLETNLIIFEVCPTGAGMAVQATINSGTYSTFFDDGDNLDVYAGTSGSGMTGTLLSADLTGDLSGTVIMGNVADECLIFVSSTGPTGSCDDGLETPLSVCGLDIAPSVNFLNPGNFCIDDLPQSGLTGGTPTGGTYSSTTPGAVIDAGDGETFVFDAVNGAGTYELIYTQGSGSDNIFVEVFATGNVTFTAPDDICIDAGTLTNQGGGNPAGGIFSGNGVTDNGDGTFDFDPVVAGLGTHLITYTEPDGCMDIATDVIEVLAACGCPAGEQTFFHCTDNNETDLVLFELCPTDPTMAIRADIAQGSYGTAFGDGDELTVYSGVSGSGTGGTIVLGPVSGNFAGTSVRSNDANECLTFVSNTGAIGSCLVDGAEQALQGCAYDVSPPTRLTSPGDFCTNAGIQMGLSGGTPAGGVYSGDIAGAVTDNADGTYDLDPSVGPGTLTITYTANGEPATVMIQLADDITPPSIVGTLPDLNIEGCDLSDAPMFASTIAELEALGLDISDDCTDDANLMVSTSGSTSGSCPIIGSFTWTITDEAGQASSITQNYTIDDTTDPTPVCQAYTLLLDANGEGMLEADDIDGGSTDNCGIASTAVNIEDFTCDDLGVNPVQLTVTDNCGNSSTCTANVTVEVSGDLPDPWMATDVGQVTVGNEYFFDPCIATNPEDGEWTITGSGNSATSSTTDNVAYASRPLCGDGTITAKVESVTNNGYGGLMIRETTDAGARQVSIFSNLTNILRHETRYFPNTAKQVQQFVKPNPFWLRLERSGDWIFAYYSTTGANFIYVHAVNVAMQDCVEIGLASFTYLVNAQTDAVFSNVEVIGNSNLGGVEVPESMAIDQSGIERFTLFPNPANDVLISRFDQPMERVVSLSIYNQLGQLIEQRQLQAGATQLEWNTTSLPAGAYFMKIDGIGIDTQVKAFTIAR